MSEHTPGPWHVKFNPVNIAVLTLDLVYIAESIRAVSRDEAEANARLIAAAPELLAALEMIRDADNDCRRDGLNTLPRAPRAAIDAAIAKAEGRS